MQVEVWLRTKIIDTAISEDPSYVDLTGFELVQDRGEFRHDFNHESIDVRRPEIVLIVAYHRNVVAFLPLSKLERTVCRGRRRIERVLIEFLRRGITENVLRNDVAPAM